MRKKRVVFCKQCVFYVVTKEHSISEKRCCHDDCFIEHVVKKNTPVKPVSYSWDERVRDIKNFNQYNDCSRYIKKTFVKGMKFFLGMKVEK